MSATQTRQWPRTGAPTQPRLPSPQCRQYVCAMERVACNWLVEDGRGQTRSQAMSVCNFHRPTPTLCRRSPNAFSQLLHRSFIELVRFLSVGGVGGAGWPVTWSPADTSVSRCSTARRSWSDWSGDGFSTGWFTFRSEMTTQSLISGVAGRTRIAGVDGCSSSPGLSSVLLQTLAATA